MQDEVISPSKVEDSDEERYSRQVYALGHRAHGLIRSSTVYLDGPPSSGLMYEIAKNLALSGIRRLVLVVPSPTSPRYNNPSAYHNPELDDLGCAYISAATRETTEADNQNDNTINQCELLLEYVKRLNPSLLVEQRAVEDVSFDFSSQKKDEDEARPHISSHQFVGDNGPIVYMAIDRCQSTCEEINDWLRQQQSDRSVDNPLTFIAVETAGVFGRIFTDFGDEFVVHDSDGEQPALTPLLQVSCEAEGDEGATFYNVQCLPGEKHDVSKGDDLQFHLRNGECLEVPWTCTVERVISPFMVRVRFSDGEEGVENSKAILEQIQTVQPVAFSRIKKPQTLSFVSLREALQQQQSTDGQSLVTPSDLEKSLDTERQRIVLSCFSSLNTFVKEQSRLPLSNDEQDFIASSNLDVQSDQDKAIVADFVRSCSGKLVPLQGIIGAIAAQEALKAVSGLYTPIRQFLLFDCQELMVSDGPRTSVATDAASSNAKIYSKGLRYILGDDVVEKLHGRKIFIAGAGAIGCELLKNLGAMGAGTAKIGKIMLTDMDTIEKSNLSRQLLFRETDLGDFKSVAAKRGTLLFNPDCEIEAHSSKLGKRTGEDSSGNVFEDDDTFWSHQVDIVLNALDNVDARLYMDGQCVTNHIALVDAGTLGPKGNVQVVIPKLSESYASSADPPEEAIPVCTLKNFPYAISHTIQWSRDLFDGLFVQRPQQANDFATSLQIEEDSGKLEDSLEVHKNALRTMAHKLLHESGEQAAIRTAEELKEDILAATLIVGHTNIRSHSLKWAVSLARKLYVESVDELLEQHPLGSKDEDGEDFWTGTRRAPTRLVYDSSENASLEQVQVNRNLVSFVRHGARLRAEAFLPPSSTEVLFSSEEAVEALLGSHDVDSIHSDTANGSSLSKQEQIFRYLSSIPPGSEVELNLADFEKDDDSNGHVSFIAAASNLRAISYGIPPVSAMETRRVAGKIIPAMITTTALVSALSCLELVKLVQKAPLNQYRNAFVNLALPFFAFTVPMPAEVIPGLNGQEYTLWDQLSISESAKTAANKSGGMTMKSLLKRIQKLADSENAENVRVLSVSLGPYLLYANFLHEDDKELMKTAIWEVIHEAISSDEDDEDARDTPVEQYSMDDKTFDLSVVVEDDGSEEEVELPTIRLRRFEKT